MFGIGQPELLVILFIALLFFGPSSLPKLSKTVGESASALRDGFTGGENDKSLGDIAKEVTSSVKEVKQSIAEVKQVTLPTASHTYGQQAYNQKENT